MDFDPGMFSDDDSYEESYEEGYEEGYDDATDELTEESWQEEASDVLDDEPDVVALAGAAGFGYHMCSEELEERKIAEYILKRKTNKEPEKISLKSRKLKKYTGSPAQRWMFRVANGEKKTTDPVEYTEEEKKAILQYEGEHDFIP